LLIDINKIKVNDRIRKDFGNIEELANDIKENGLINPPVVTPEYELIAGERRLKALQFLKYPQIEVRIMTVKDSEHQLNLEISENENRKEFTFSERVDWAKRLERIEKIKAKERMESGGKEIFPDGEQGQVRDIVADKSGIGSGKQYEKAKFISDNADDEMIRQLDEGKLSINRAYQTLKQQNEQLEQQLQKERNKQPQIIDKTDYTTIDTLRQNLQRKEKDIEFLKKDKEILEKKVKLNAEEAKKYNDLKSQIEELSHTKDDISKKINAATSLSGLVVEIRHLVQTKLAPIKYSNDLLTMQNDKVFIENLSEIIDTVKSWYEEINKYLPNNIIDINVEVIK
jgi:ParB family chromosome partitioning protein